MFSRAPSLRYAIVRPLFAPLLLLVLLPGCQGQNPGDKCDGFFQNTCKSPLTCISIRQNESVFDKKVCAGSCDHSFACKDRKGCCPSGFHCADVSIGSGPGEGLGMGGHCLPASLVGE